MWAVLAIVAGIIFLFHYPSSSESQEHKPFLFHYPSSSESQEHKPRSLYKSQNKAEGLKPSLLCVNNTNVFDTSEWRRQILENVMEALADPDTHLIGVYSLQEQIRDALYVRVERRVQKAQMFGKVVVIGYRDDVRETQKDIARGLRYTFKSKSKTERANELIRRIKNERTILIMLRHLKDKLDLRKVGIPYGSDHPGRCKILLISTNERVLSKHMKAQKIFMV